MKTKIILSALFCLLAASLTAQELSPETLSKRAKRKNLIIKEWNTNANAKTRWLDHYTKYDDQGRKVEEIEYTTYGQKSREVIEYNEKGFVDKDIIYDDRNKVVRVRKYEYNPDGSRKKQYNYLPNGKLYSIKIFEYIEEGDK